jgi:hypothetical protein
MGPARKKHNEFRTIPALLRFMRQYHAGPRGPSHGIVIRPSSSFIGIILPFPMAFSLMERFFPEMPRADV